MNLEMVLWNAGLSHAQRKARRDAIAPQGLQRYVRAVCLAPPKAGK